MAERLRLALESPLIPLAARQALDRQAQLNVALALELRAVRERLVLVESALIKRKE